MGYTQKAKAWVILSNYVHREKNSLSDAMVRYMACRLWSEFLWQMPDGKRGAAKTRGMPHLTRSTVMYSERRTENGKQAAQARGDSSEVTAG